MSDECQLKEPCLNRLDVADSPSEVNILHASPFVLFAMCVAAERTLWSDRDTQCAYSLLATSIRRLRSIVTTMVQVEHRSRHRTIALFDVDGTLSVARKVCTGISRRLGSCAAQTFNIVQAADPATLAFLQELREVRSTCD